MREVFSESLIVIGDRLHGLIVGATEGAVPLGWVESSSGKIARHFSHLNFESTYQHEGDSAANYPVLDSSSVDQMRLALSEMIVSSKNELSLLVSGLSKRLDADV